MIESEQHLHAHFQVVEFTKIQCPNTLFFCFHLNIIHVYLIKKNTLLFCVLTFSRDSDLETAWSGCLEYMARCVSRRAQLESALASPARDLGLANLDRCRGYAQHLQTILLQQHQQTATLLGEYTAVR